MPNKRLITRLIFSGTTLLGMFSGCAPARFEDGVAWSINRYRTTNASTRPVSNKPYLRVNDYLIDRLKSVSQSPELPGAAVRLNDLLSQAHQLAMQSAADEVDRLPDRAIDQLWRHYFQEQPKHESPRQAVKQRYAEQLNNDYSAFLANVSDASSPEQIGQIALSVVRDAGPSAKDQRGAGTLLEMVATKYERATPDIEALPGPFNIYTLGTAGDFDSIDENDAAALARFAPALLQQRPTKPNYPPDDDDIGAVSLSGSSKNILVNIDTARPQVYAYTHKAIVGEKEYLQLVYCWWFPQHPAMSPGDPEAGNVDGATIRITLDTRGRPAILETIQNCGCHIRCFASDDIETRARSEYSAKSTNDNALEKPTDAKPRLDVSGTFESPESNVDPHLVAVSRAGFHDVVEIQGNLAAVMNTRQIASRQEYQLLPYETLEHLPTNFGHASMFGPDGLVHNAGRLEGWLLAPTGMRSAGQPRQRGTQLICWDALDFDDPHLLEKTLQLPSDF